mmetsp:Transcript_26901/g.59056  ORF Transcript_26901/g.59056 Transcript_26901/m.59056 type:complete len:497 (+) Transcript_26901:407-1897(+)
MPSLSSSSLLLQSSIIGHQKQQQERRRQNRGRRLCNSKAQLLRLNALYDQDNSNYSDSDKHNDDYDHPLGRSSSTASSSFVENDDANDYAIIGEHVDDGDSDDDHYSYNSNSFLLEARASLRDLDEWQHFRETDDVGYSSSCDASCNSSNYANDDDDVFDVSFGVDAANAVNDSFCSESSSRLNCSNGSGASYTSSNHLNNSATTKRRSRQPSCHPESTSSWLKEMKDEDFQQRKRIAEAIAAASQQATINLPGSGGYTRDTTHTATVRTKTKASTSVKKYKPESVLKKSIKLFHKENLGIDRGCNSSMDKQQRKEGRKSSVGSFLRSFHGPSTSKSTSTSTSISTSASTLTSISTTISACPPTKQKEQVDSFKEKRFDDNHVAICKKNNRSESRQPPAADTDAAPSAATVRNDKDLQLRRAVFGTARVLTMDGIVESFACPTSTTANAAAKAMSGQESMDAQIHAQIHMNSKLNPRGCCDYDSTPTTSNAPLTWV